MKTGHDARSRHVRSHNDSSRVEPCRQAANLLHQAGVLDAMSQTANRRKMSRLELLAKSRSVTNGVRKLQVNSVCTHWEFLCKSDATAGRSRRTSVPCMTRVVKTKARRCEFSRDYELLTQTKKPDRQHRMQRFKSRRGLTKASPAG